MLSGRAAGRTKKPRLCGVVIRVAGRKAPPFAAGCADSNENREEAAALPRRHLSGFRAFGPRSGPDEKTA
ncbi:hypothetical protein, partial [Desulfovibrio sp.]|uniref:hypothetical protein n=1 Tax=Desulfovibrio sp. TaxID=885 RepID=UPI0025BEF462